MENSPYVYKPPQQEGIHGWLAAFLILTGIGILGSIVLSILNFNMEDYSWTGNHLTTFILSAIDLLFIIGVVGFGIFMIYSFIKRNPNAPVYGIIYYCLLLYSNLIHVFIALIDGDTDVAAISEVKVARSIVWSIIWILYLTLSDQVAGLFPKENRKLPNTILLIAVAIVLCPFIGFFIGVYIAAGL